MLSDDFLDPANFGSNSNNNGQKTVEEFPPVGFYDWGWVVQTRSRTESKKTITKSKELVVFNSIESIRFSKFAYNYVNRTKTYLFNFIMPWTLLVILLLSAPWTMQFGQTVPILMIGCLGLILFNTFRARRVHQLEPMGFAIGDTQENYAIYRDLKKASAKHMEQNDMFSFFNLRATVTETMAELNRDSYNDEDSPGHSY